MTDWGTVLALEGLFFVNLPIEAFVIIYLIKRWSKTFFEPKKKKWKLFG